MKVLFDTNVVLDVLLDRPPFAWACGQLLARVERGEIEGYLGATTVTTIHYLVERAAGRERAMEAVQGLLRLFRVAAVDERVLDSAVRLPLADYEDAVLHEAGRLAGAESVVTRDGKGFRGGSLEVHAPEDLALALSQARRD